MHFVTGLFSGINSTVRLSSSERYKYEVYFQLLRVILFLEHENCKYIEVSILIFVYNLSFSNPKFKREEVKKYERN